MMPSDSSLQFDENGNLKHFLTINGLPRQTLINILDSAESFINFDKREIKKVPLLRGKTLVNLFFEPSTRTRTTFEIAGKRLSADVINLSASRMSTAKGETILDTVRTLEAMHTDLFVVRDHASGAAHLIASHLPDHVHVINAGDGRHAPPNPGDAGHVHYPAIETGIFQPDSRHHRRCPAFEGGALANPCPEYSGG